MNLLQELLTKSNDVDLDMVKWPEDKLKEGQTGVGTASDDAKRLWGLVDLIQDQMIPLIEEHDEFCDGNCAALSEDDQERHRILKTKADRINIERNLVMNIFWKTLRLEIPEIANKECIGICLDGEIYWEACDHNHGINMDIMMIGGNGPMPSILADLFGRS